MKNLLFGIFLFVLCQNAFATKKIEGVIIYEDDTVETTFNLPFSLLGDPSYIKIQNKVRYFENGKKKTIRPEDAKEIHFKINGEKIRMISVQVNLGNRLFLKYNGGTILKHYDYYVKSQEFVGTSSTSSVQLNDLLLKKGEIITISSFNIGGFRKPMMRYFSDCPALVEKIKEKEFSKYDVDRMVRFYNSRCAK